VKVFYHLFIYVLLLEIQLSRGDGWDSINSCYPLHFCACLKPGSGFPTSNVMVFFMFSEFC